MKPLVKTTWINLPLSVPAEWSEFFEKAARTLGGSRNQVMCMALKLGGPILSRYIEVMHADLRQHYDKIGHIPETPDFNSEILGSTGPAGINANFTAHDRKRTKQPGAGKPGRRKKGR